MGASACITPRPMVQRILRTAAMNGHSRTLSLTCFAGTVPGSNGSIPPCARFAAGPLHHPRARTTCAGIVSANLSASTAPGPLGYTGMPCNCLFRCSNTRGWFQLAAPLGQLMWETLIQFRDITDIDRIIPVPLHWRRKRRRGFNQAELLMRRWPKLARENGVALDHRKIAPEILIRHRPTPPQTGLGQKARKQNLHRAFRIKATHAVRGCSILIVDDVLTTGATADACARALKRAGAASVFVLTLARAI